MTLLHPELNHFQYGYLWLHHVFERYDVALFGHDIANSIGATRSKKIAFDAFYISPNPFKHFHCFIEE
jgi:hypothetical protein